MDFSSEETDFHSCYMYFLLTYGKIHGIIPAENKRHGSNGELQLPIACAGASTTYTTDLIRATKSVYPLAIPVASAFSDFVGLLHLTHRVGLCPARCVLFSILNYGGLP